MQSLRGCGTLDAAFPYLGDELLDDLHLDGAVAVGAAVFVGGLAAGGRAVQARPTRGLHFYELGAAPSAGGRQLDSALDADGPVATALLRLLHVRGVAASCWR
jgi:hypothetical protein